MLNDFVAGAIANGRIDILSDGTPWRPLIPGTAREVVWTKTCAGAEACGITVKIDGSALNRQLTGLVVKKTECANE